MTPRWDVIVVGGGHAGCEAALAAARMGAATLMFVIKYESIGRMSCNPSVGGPAKGHVAREIDALGGEMARVADLTGIQFRMLNRGKGPAVWAPRSQNDRLFYGVEMRRALENQPGLTLREGTVTALLTDTRGHIRGILTQIGEECLAPKVILACGTFLEGTVHVGHVSFSAGRSGEPAACGLSVDLAQRGVAMGRFKTGTPPRVDIDTVDLSVMEEQPGDPDPTGFSFYRDIPLRNLVSCYLTRTTAETHRLIRENLSRTALYGGKISGRGPRYCPSIEDKIVKFGDREAHHVFIEPEGLHTREAYVNGISTSLPPDVQAAMLASVPGLEKAKVIRWAYAIEYDLILPGQIDATLQVKRIPGLYAAGQINGTSGYEEAACQGLVAAVNCVLSLDHREPFLPDRSISYTGVLIDDLVTKGTDEPYRLFTSRAEYRLFLRQDNADERMMPLGRELGLLDETRWNIFQQRMAIRDREMDILRHRNSLPHPNQQEPTRLVNLLKRPEINIRLLAEYGYTPPPDVDDDILNRLEFECKYEGYLKRQQFEIERHRDQEHRLLPEEIDYMGIAGIAWEAREKLQRIKPRSVGQASRIPGISANDLMNLTIHLKKRV